MHFVCIVLYTSALHGRRQGGVILIGQGGSILIGPPLTNSLPTPMVIFNLFLRDIPILILQEFCIPFK